MSCYTIAFSQNQKEIIDVITTIAVYKFANLSREEVEAMLGVRLEETRVYQEAKEQGLQRGIEQGREQAKLELIPRFLAYGISIEEVAQLLHLTIEQVEQIRLKTEQESSTSTQ